MTAIVNTQYRISLTLAQSLLAANTAVRQCSKNPEATSKSKAPEGWREATSLGKDPTLLSVYPLTVIWRFLFGACEPIRVFACKGKTAVVVMKISGATLHTVVARATKRPEICAPLY